MKNVAVIGAGPAGLTAAYQLSKSADVRVTLFEASGSVGGLAKTIDLWGQRVDIGPHRFFSTDSRVNRFWLEIVEDRYEMVNRLTRIFYNGKFFYYPLKPIDAFSKLGPIESARCFISYLAERASPTKLNGDFESWVTSRFGKRLFEVFFKTYSEKLWGISCKELDSDFAAQRIKKLSLLEAVKNAFTGGGGHKTLVDKFAYPTGGTGMVYQQMAERFVANGGDLRLRTPVERVRTRDGKAVGLTLSNGEEHDFDAVISSMPLSLLVSRLGDAPEEIREKANSLRFRNTILVYLNVDSPDLFKDNWLYVHSPTLNTGRITNFRNWVPDLSGEERSSILCMEYWCFAGDETWVMPDEELSAMAIRELNETGLNEGAAVLETKVHRIDRCYPVYSKGYRDTLEPIEEYLKTVGNLIAIGRYGAFKYNNQDHSILMGLLAAENVLTDAGNDLWEINTDYDEYQEASIITDTGLQKQ